MTCQNSKNIISVMYDKNLQNENLEVTKKKRIFPHEVFQW